MTKDEAIRTIENSDSTRFTVKCYKGKNSFCDLCHKETEREFLIQTKHIGTEFGKKNYKFKKEGNVRITRHICVDCFVKLFPNSVENDEFMADKDGKRCERIGCLNYGNSSICCSNGDNYATF